MRLKAKWLLFLMVCCALPVAAQAPAAQAVENKDLPKYSDVNPQLGVGAQPTDDGFRRLVEMGYRAVVNLRTDQENFDLAAEEKLVSGLGLKYFNIPVISKDPREEQALRFLKVMDELKGQKVFVHCAGAVRASAFVMIDLVLREGMNAAEAEELATKTGLSSDILRRFARQVIESQKKP
jgi:protein tyrosine phosphatase (PTP) superfamily phosphohydrolase (DUF442 family)